MSRDKFPFGPLGQHFAHQRDRERPLFFEGNNVQPVEHPLKAGEVAGKPREEVVRHFIAELEAALPGGRLQVRPLLRVRQALELIHEPPGEARAKVIAQRELCRRRTSRSEDAGAALAGVIDRD